jgi:hypothetical protein
MQKIFRIIIFFILTISFSCEDQSFIVQCSDCVPDEPVTAELYADLDPDYYYECLVQIWEGNLEDSILVNSYPTYTKTFTQEVTINKKYTITATYYISNVRYIAVDSATPRVKYEKSQCEEPCFFLYDRQCDLRLKYTK